MKFSVAAVLAAVAGAHAWANNVTYTTEVVTALTTYCPEATQITHGGVTYTVTEPTTLTISNCPCTVTKPVTVVSSVICHTCAPPAQPTWPAKNNATVPVVPTGGAPASPTASKPAQVTAGAGKAAALSGAGLAGVLGLAAFIL